MTHRALPGGPDLLEGGAAHLASEGAASGRLDDQSPEQSLPERTCITLASGRRCEAGKQMRSLTQQLPSTCDCLPWLDRVHSRAGAMYLGPIPVPDRDGLHTGDDEGQAARERPIRARHRTCHRMLVVALRRFAALLVAECHSRIRSYGRDGRAVAREALLAETGAGHAVLGEAPADAGLVLTKEVCERDLENVAGIGPQDERPRPLAVTQADFTRFELAAPRLRARMIGAAIRRGALGAVGRRHIAPQGVDHPEGIEGAETIVDEQMVESDDVGMNDSRCIRRKGLACPHGEHQRSRANCKYCAQ